MASLAELGEINKRFVMEHEEIDKAIRLRVPEGVARKAGAGALAASMLAGGGAAGVGAVKGGQAVVRATEASQKSARMANYNAENVRRAAAGQPKQFFSFENQERILRGPHSHRFGPQ